MRKKFKERTKSKPDKVWKQYKTREWKLVAKFIRRRCRVVADNQDEFSTLCNSVTNYIISRKGVNKSTYPRRNDPWHVSILDGENNDLHWTLSESIDSYFIKVELYKCKEADIIDQSHVDKILSMIESPGFKNLGMETLQGLKQRRLNNLKHESNSTNKTKVSTQCRISNKGSLMLAV